MAPLPPQITTAQQLSNLQLDDANEARKPLQFVLIDGYAVDCTPKQDHTYESDITEFPAETGSDFSDNIRNKPITVVIEGIVSNTQIGDIITQPQRFGEDGVLPSDDAYSLLMSIRDARTIVTITTSVGVFTNMALKSLSLPKAEHEADCLRFTATFHQIQVKTTVRASIPVAAAPKTITRAPIAGGPVFRSSRAISQLGTTQYWYDPNINEWRQAVDIDDNGIYVLYRGQVFPQLNSGRGTIGNPTGASSTELDDMPPPPRFPGLDENANSDIVGEELSRQAIAQNIKYLQPSQWREPNELPGGVDFALRQAGMSSGDISDNSIANQLQDEGFE